MKYEFDLSPEEENHVLNVVQPTGFRILVGLPKIAEKMGSIYIPDARKADEEVASILGKVVAMGDSAYEDRARFPFGEYCKPGDVVMMASYSGRRFKINGREYRLINDDSVMAVIKQPEEIERA